MFHSALRCDRCKGFGQTVQTHGLYSRPPGRQKADPGCVNRFGSIHDAVTRFLKSVPDVNAFLGIQMVVYHAQAYSTLEKIHSLSGHTTQIGEIVFYAPEVVVEVLGPLLHMKTLMEAENVLNIHLLSRCLSTSILSFVIWHTEF